MRTPVSKLESLAELIRDDGLGTKPALLRVLTDFYIQKPIHSPEEIRHFTELALRLIDDVDRSTRRDIARRLANHGGTPEIVLRRLSADLHNDDFEAYETLYPEKSALPGPSAAAAVPVPPEITAQDRAAATGFSEQFFTADSRQRAALLRELDTGAAVMPLGIASAEAAAVCRNLESAALRSRPYEFVVEMERALSIPRPVAQAIVNDLSGEPMLVIAKALGMPIDVLQRILLLVNPAVGTSVRRVFDLSELYQKMSAHAALRLISLWRYSEQPVQTEAPSPARLSSSERRSFIDTARRQINETQPDQKKHDQRAS